MASTNIHIYPSPLTHESRILRITDALAKAAIFDQIEVYGVSAPDLPDRQPVDAKRTFLRYPRTVSYTHLDVYKRQSTIPPKAFSPTRSAP